MSARRITVHDAQGDIVGVVQGWLRERSATDDGAILDMTGLAMLVDSEPAKIMTGSVEAFIRIDSGVRAWEGVARFAGATSIRGRWATSDAATIAIRMAKP